VILPGVQVLFAFLLTIPFTNRFSELSGVDQGLYYVAFVGAAISSVLLSTPGVQHRLRFRKHDKEYLLRLANVFAIAGTIVFTVSLGASVWLVTDVLYGGPLAVGTAVGVLLVVVLVWYVTPLLRGAQRDDSNTSEASKNR
jgi:membrane protein implicated in regulation of membrane protease activity